MTTRLPSTCALLALEAAARHPSFARAAQELALSEGRLSAPWPMLPQFRERYVLVTRPAAESPPALAIFTRWLLAEGAVH